MCLCWLHSCVTKPPCAFRSCVSNSCVSAFFVSSRAAPVQLHAHTHTHTPHPTPHTPHPTPHTPTSVVVVVVRCCFCLAVSISLPPRPLPKTKLLPSSFPLLTPLPPAPFPLAPRETFALWLMAVGDSLPLYLYPYDSLYDSLPLCLYPAPLLSLPLSCTTCDDGC